PVATPLRILEPLTEALKLVDAHRPPLGPPRRYAGSSSSVGHDRALLGQRASAPLEEMTLSPERHQPMRPRCRAPTLAARRVPPMRLKRDANLATSESLIMPAE